MKVCACHIGMIVGSVLHTFVSVAGCSKSNKAAGQGSKTTKLTRNQQQLLKLTLCRLKVIVSKVSVWCQEETRVLYRGASTPFTRHTVRWYPVKLNAGLT